MQIPDARQSGALLANDGSVSSHGGLVRPAAVLADPESQDVFHSALRFSPKAGDGRARIGPSGGSGATGYHAAREAHAGERTASDVLPFREFSSACRGSESDPSS